MIPIEIKKSHILMAIQKVEKLGYEVKYESKGYDLIHNGKKYPTKYIISLAYEFVSGHPYSVKNFSGGEEANRFLKKLGFKVENKIDAKYLPFQIEDEEEERYFEGREKYELHKLKERDTNLSKDKKESVLKNKGKLICEACGFDFYQFYGKRGRGYIECHHNKPVSSLLKSTAVQFNDLSLLCSNCHRIIHRIRPWISVKDLKKLVHSV